MGANDPEFDVTVWSLVAPEQPLSDQENQERLDRLTEMYYAPMKAYLRGFLSDFSEADVEDCLHDFVVNRFRRGFFDREWDQTKKFRHYLKVTLKHRARDFIRQRRKYRAEDLDSPGVAQMLTDRERSAVSSFDAAWARGILQTAIHEMKEGCRRDSRRTEWNVFNARILRPSLTGSPEPTYQQLADRFGLETEGAVSHLLRCGKCRFIDILETRLRNNLDKDETVQDVLDQVCARLAMSDERRIRLPDDSSAEMPSDHNASAFLASFSRSVLDVATDSIDQLGSLSVAAFLADDGEEQLPDAWRTKTLAETLAASEADPAPQELLEVIKDRARARAKLARGPYAVLYHATMAAAWVQHGADLSSLTIKQQHDAFAKHLTGSSLPAPYPELFLKAHQLTHGQDS